MSSPVRFASFKRLLESHGWELTRINGSHHIFTKPGAMPISVPVKQGKVKARYVENFQKVIEEAKRRDKSTRRDDEGE